jgi:hypothetical protein
MSAAPFWAEAVELPARFFGALDGRRYADVAALMCRTGSWHRQGKVLDGPEGVLAALEERPADFSTAHVLTNLVVDEVGVTTRVSFLSTVYAHKGSTSAPLPLVAPVQINRYEATCMEEDGSLKVLELKSSVLFKTEDRK